jgi:hypothetical protein
MQYNRALDAAIALSQTPTLAAAMRAQELPTGVKLLLRILANEADALSEARNLTGMSNTELIAIVELYVMRVLLYRGAPARRVLGVGSDADRTEMRRHMAYLLAWLHPDKSPGAWPIAFASRVIAAWRSIDRGREDESRPGRLPVSSRSRRSHRVPWIPLPVEATRKSRHLRKVSRFVLLGLVIVGVALTTGVFSNQISQLLSATSLFAASLSSRSEFSLDR